MRMRLLLLLLLLSSAAALCQTGITAAGAGFGGGTIQGNSPSVFSYSASVFADLRITSNPALIWRVSGWLLKDFNSVVPANTLSSYYSYVYGASVQGVLLLPASPLITITCGAGPLYVSDHTFSGESGTGAGVLISVGVFYGGQEAGCWQWGAETGSGITFTGTQPRLFTLHATVRKTF